MHDLMGSSCSGLHLPWHLSFLDSLGGKHHGDACLLVHLMQRVTLSRVKLHFNRQARVVRCGKAVRKKKTQNFRRYSCSSDHQTLQLQLRSHSAAHGRAATQGTAIVQGCRLSDALSLEPSVFQRVSVCWRHSGGGSCTKQMCSDPGSKV